MTKFLILLQESPASYDTKMKETHVVPQEDEEKPIGFIQALAIPVSWSLFYFKCYDWEKVHEHK